jgi:ketosteroid isomerase-like protein
MRALRIPLSLVAVTAVLSLACHPRTSPAPSSAADAEIRAVLDSTAAGWNRGDLGPYMAAYAADADAGGSNGFVHGPVAIEEGMRRGFWKSGRPTQQLHYEHLAIRMLGASDALVTGQYVLSGADLPDRTGWFTTVWEHRPEGWRMIHDHS